MVKLTITQGETIGGVELWCYVSDHPELDEFIKENVGLRLFKFAPGTRGNRYEEVDVEILNETIPDVVSWLDDKAKQALNAFNACEHCSAAADEDEDRYCADSNYYELEKAIAYTLLIRMILDQAYENAR